MVKKKIPNYLKLDIISRSKEKLKASVSPSGTAIHSFIPPKNVPSFKPQKYPSKLITLLQTFLKQTPKL